MSFLPKFKPPASLFQTIVDANNAVLVFSVPDGTGTTDPATGNFVPNVTEERVEAYLKQNGDNARRTSPATKGVKIVSGWLTNPKVAPVEVREDLIIDAIIDGERGRLEFFRPIQPPLMRPSIDQGIWGQAVSGKFRPDSV